MSQQRAFDKLFIKFAPLTLLTLLSGAVLFGALSMGPTANGSHCTKTVLSQSSCGCCAHRNTSSLAVSLAQDQACSCAMSCSSCSMPASQRAARRSAVSGRSCDSKCTRCSLNACPCHAA